MFMYNNGCNGEFRINIVECVQILAMIDTLEVYNIKHTPEIPMLINVIVEKGHVNVQLWDQNILKREYKILQCYWDFFRNKKSLEESDCFVFIHNDSVYLNWEKVFFKFKKESFYSDFLVVNSFSKLVLN